MATIITIWWCAIELLQKLPRRLIYFDMQWKTWRTVVRVTAATVPTGTTGQGTKKINLGNKLDIVTGSDRTCFHEILMRVEREPGTHEYIEYIVNM